MSDDPDWATEGRDWPNRAASRFVEAGGLRWHVQLAGAGPPLLLLHGTGAATHSWRDLLPLLTRHFSVCAPDLPGHGFTGRPAALSLPAMAGAVAALLETLALQPAIAIGHSAGAAILARMALDGRIAPRLLVGLNAALLPLPGFAGQLFSPLAKMFANLPLVPSLFAWRAADPAVVRRLLAQTGSAVDPAAVRFYGRLVRRSGHVAGALGMMAQWELAPLADQLVRLRPPPVLIVGGNDKTISPNEASRVRSLVPGTRIVTMPGLGHLAHEERPADVATLLTGLWTEAGGAETTPPEYPPAG